jgi:hypothetical protein
MNDYKIGTLLEEGQTWVQSTNTLMLDAIYRLTLEAYDEYERVHESPFVDDITSSIKHRNHLLGVIRKLYRAWNNHADDFDQDFYDSKHAEIFEELFGGSNGN